MKYVVMVGTAYDVPRGGVAAVVNVYRAAGLFERVPVRYLASHRDGGAGRKVGALVVAWATYLGLLVTGRVGLVHVHTSSRTSFWRKCLFLLPAQWLHIPAVVHLHSSEFALFYERECGPRRQRVIRSVLARADAVLVLSSGWKQWLAGVAPQARVEVFPNPVVVPRTPPPDDARDGRMVLSLGRLGATKGSYDLLRAVAALRGRQVAVRLRLAGDGEIEAVRRRARELGVQDEVTVLGWLDHDAKARELAQASVYALPSYHEAQPMSVLEAMAAGLPVVATPVGGTPDAVSDGVEGYLVQPGDVDALARRLEVLLTAPAHARALGRAAFAKVRDRFSADDLVPRVEALYRRLGYRP